LLAGGILKRNKIKCNNKYESKVLLEKREILLGRFYKVASFGVMEY
jgi:hypothetical protein